MERRFNRRREGGFDRGGGFRGGGGGGFRRDFDRPKPVKIGEEYDVTITDVGAKGDGITKVENFIVFVSGGRKGEHCKIRIKEVANKFAIAEKVSSGEDEKTEMQESESEEAETEGTSSESEETEESTESSESEEESESGSEEE